MTSAAPKLQPEASSPQHDQPKKIDVSRMSLLIAAAATFVVATAVMWIQLPAPGPHAPSPRGWRWFFSFREHNPEKSLAIVEADLNAVQVTTNGSLWVAGTGGMLLHSPDGWHWQQVPVSTHAAPAPRSAARNTPRSGDWFSLVPTALAAAAAPTSARVRSVSSKGIEVIFPQPLLSRITAEQVQFSGNLASPSASPRVVEVIQIDKNAALIVMSPEVSPRESFTVCFSKLTFPGDKGQPVEWNGCTQYGVGLQNQTVRNDSYQNAAPPILSQGKTPASQTPPANRPADTPIISKQNPAPQPTTPTPAQPGVMADTFIAVYFEDDANGRVLTDSGKIYSTNDGGKSWTRRFSEENGKPVILGPRQYSFVNTGNGRQAQIISTWTKSSPPWSASPGGLSQNTGGALNLSIVRLHVPKEQALSQACALGNSVWAVGRNGALWTSVDNGANWTSRSIATVDLRDVVFATPQNGWATGSSGTILATTDGGVTWSTRTQGVLASDTTRKHSHGLPPWYYASLLLVVGMAAAGASKLSRTEEKPEEPETKPGDDSPHRNAELLRVADILVQDGPLRLKDPDPLGFRKIAFGLSRFLRNEKTLPPLTISISGPWGSGKTSIMNMLREDLERYGWDPVWFNAWHHQKEDYLLAALLQNIRLQAVPPIWKLKRLRGLRFRIHLIHNRVVRNLPMIALAAFLLSLLMALEWRYPIYQVMRDFLGIQSLDNLQWKTLVSTFSDVPIFAVTSTILTALAGLWKGATAFGVNPASLLASRSAGAKVASLDEQTSFREKFAEEFRDVTRALGEQSMIIFIDDLDRCRPENVRDVLEAVNFLVSSGDCFVVMGMDRDSVTAAVGISFKEVAEEQESRTPNRRATDSPDLSNKDVAAMRTKGEKPSAEAVDGARTPNRRATDSPVLTNKDVAAMRVEGQKPDADAEAVDAAKARRKLYATRYLDKLVNVELTVPVADSDRAAAIMLPPVIQSQPRWKTFGREFAHVLAPLLVAAFMIAAGGLAGWYVQDHYVYHPPVWKPYSRSLAVHVETPGTTSAAEGTSSTGTGPLISVATQLATMRQPSDVATVGREKWVLAFPVLALAFALIAGFIFAPPGALKDSPPFKTAIGCWAPVVFIRDSTPRSVKRFMNRVRLLAMRVREDSADDNDAPPSALRLWMNKMFARAHGSEQKELAGGGMSESALVALSTLYYVNPGLVTLDNLRNWENLDVEAAQDFTFDTLENLGMGDEKIAEMISTAIADHKKQFGWSGVVGCFKEFEVLTKGTVTR